MPSIGARYLDEIRPEAIAALLIACGTRYTVGTMNRVLVLVKRLFNLARAWRTPASRTILPPDMRLGAGGPGRAT